MDNNYFAIIVGAGASGISAAKYLHRLGKSYIVLEAQNRIGGRVWTDKTSFSYPVEQGGEFLHGGYIATNILAQSFNKNLIYVPRYHPDHFWWAGGGRSGSDGKAFQINDVKNERERNLIKRMYSDLSTGITNFKNKGDISVQEYFSQLGYDAEEIKKADVLFSQTNCINISQLSLRELSRDAEMDHSGPGEFRVKEGMQTILENYSQELNIVLNSEVIKINWKPNECKVITKDKKVYKSEKVLITFSISYLQQHLNIFEPPLPDFKIESIMDFFMRPATKLLFFFNKLFWKESMAMLASNCLLARWWTPFYTLKTKNDQYSIVCYITAERAEHIDSLDLNDAKELGFKELSRMFGIDYEEIKNSCTDFKRISWAKEAFVLGGYSSPKVGTSNSSFKLSLPIEKTIFFAGEATAYDTNTQTIHGSFESGLRAAGELLDLNYSKF